MNQAVYIEFNKLIVFIIDGFIICFLFDVFRSLRKAFKTNDIITYIEDIIFWILTTLILMYSILIYSNGQIRVYVFLR